MKHLTTQQIVMLIKGLKEDPSLLLGTNGGYGLTDLQRELKRRNHKAFQKSLKTN